MAKRGIEEIGNIDDPPNAKRQKTSPQEPDILVQRAGIIQVSKKADAPFRIDERGDVDCSIDWCTYTSPEYKKTSTKGLPLSIIETYITADKLVFPQTITLFGSGFVIFQYETPDHEMYKIKGSTPFLSPWVKYEFTIVEDKSPRASSYSSAYAFKEYVIVKCRWRVPTLDDQNLSDLLSETGVAIGHDVLDTVRTAVISRGGYNEDTGTYNPKVVLSVLQDPKDLFKLQNSVYMVLRYCAPAVLIYGHTNTSRTSYSSLMAISNCLLSSTWYHLFFQWFKRMPETLLPQESRFLRELSLSDLPTVQNYFCIQATPDNTMIEECIKVYDKMKAGPYKKRDTLCHLPELLREARITTPEDAFMRFATKKSILRSETNSAKPGRWVLSFGDFEAERRIINIITSLKRKETEGVSPSNVFDREYIEQHDTLDDIQKSILCDIINPRNPRRFLVFSGQAGTGKTTIIKALLESGIRYLEKNPPLQPKQEYGKPPKPPIIPDPEIGVFTAYGFMAATIRNATGHMCTMTIMRAIAIMDIEDNITAKVNLQKLKTVIIDEMSTANIEVIANLLAGMPQLERVFFFGDPQQMPTIERGSICECFLRIFKTARIDKPDVISQNPDCTIFKLMKNYRQAGNRILIDNFQKILAADAAIDFKVIKSLKDFKEANHPFIVLPIPENENIPDVTRAINIVAREYLQSAEDSQRIMIMAQRKEDVARIKECLDSCDTYIKKLMPAPTTKQTTLFNPKPASAATARKPAFGHFQKVKARALVVGELVKTTLNWNARVIPGVPLCDYVPKGKIKSVPLMTSSVSNNDIGILHAIYDVNMANGCIIKSYESTDAQQTRSTQTTIYARIIVLKSPTARRKPIAKPTDKKTKKEREREEESEYLFINTREYALAHIVPRDVSTISVSQGQEAEVSCLYLPGHMIHSTTFERSQFYTGVSRGKKMVILITPVIGGKLPAVENILSNSTVIGKTNFVQKYKDALLQDSL